MKPKRGVRPEWQAAPGDQHESPLTIPADPAALLPFPRPPALAGTRHLAAARVLGQGTFAIVEHHDHTKLLYK